MQDAFAFLSQEALGLHEALASFEQQALAVLEELSGRTYLQQPCRLSYTSSFAFAFSVSCPAAATAFSIASRSVFWESKVTVSTFFALSQEAAVTPFTFVAAVSMHGVPSSSPMVF